MNSNNRGFTLIELMIAVAIIGILAAIAYPSYQNSIDKTYRSDAKAALQSFAAAMERKFTENNNYCDNANASGSGVTNCGATGAAGNDIGTPDFFSASVPVDGPAAYNLTISAVTPTTFTLTATGTGRMADDKCGDFTITSTGARGITGVTETGTALTALIDECW